MGGGIRPHGGGYDNAQRVGERDRESQGECGVWDQKNITEQKISERKPTRSKTKKRRWIRKREK